MTAPSQLGRYRLLDLLGRGGMGEVHLAAAVGAAGFQKPVVVKVLRPEFGRSPERARRLLREAFIGVGLDHEHIVSILDLGEHEGTYYIAMEYVRGYTWGHLIGHAAQSEPIPVRQVVHVARAVADALDYLHRARDEEGQPLGLLHRDVSPSNILVAADGRVKLSDLGVASLAGGESGLLVGKPPYLPPEAFDGAPATQAWDVYALGVVLWESLTGRPGFKGETLVEIADAVRAGLPPVRGLRADCPGRLADLVAAATSSNPGERFATAASLRGALGAAVPRAGDDREQFETYVAGVFTSPSFQRENGVLPSSLSLPGRRAELRKSIDVPTKETTTHRPLRLAITAAHGVAVAREEVERLAARLSTALGRPFRTVVAADYTSLIDGLVAGDVDLAWTPPAAAARALDLGATVSVTATRGGHAAYRSAIIVSAADGPTDLAGLRGGTVAWVDKSSAGGYLFALAEIGRVLGDPARVFRRQHFLGSHHAVCEAVANGWATAGATYAVRDDAGVLVSSGWTETLGERAAEVRPLAFSPPIPGDGITCRPGLPEGTVQAITEALVGLAADDAGRAILHDVFHADQLVTASAPDYGVVLEALRLAKHL